MTSTGTTTDATRDLRAAAYLDEVRRHLADLPADERDDLVDDLDAHVHEVAAGTDRPLDEVLGPPAAFADELLASAGLGPRPTAGRRGRAARAVDRLAGRADAARRHPWARAVEAFLPELRPAWWVARGWLLVSLAALATGGDAGWFPLPELFGNAFLGLLATVPAIAWSVRLGRRPTAPRWRWAVNALAILGAMLVLGSLGSDGDETYVIDGADGGGFYDPAPDPRILLRWPDGTPITDIDTWDAQGQPITGVIVGADGIPIDVGTDPAWPLPPDLVPPTTTTVPTTTVPTTTVPTTAPAPATVPGS